jgi:hypothetical protein
MPGEDDSGNGRKRHDSSNHFRVAQGARESCRTINRSVIGGGEMSAVGSQPLSMAREFRLGSVFRQSAQVLRENAGPFGLLCLGVNAPSVIYEFATQGLTGIDPSTGADSGLNLAESFFNLLAQAAITYGTLQYLRGRGVSTGDFLSRGLTQAAIAIRVALLSGLCIGLGLLALLIPGLILYVVWWVAIPIAVIERPGTIASLRRSAALTKGYRWQVVGLILGFLLIAVAVLVVVAVIGAVASEMIAGYGPGPVERARTLVLWFAIAAMVAVQATLVAVTYYHLRVAKEGVDIDDIAAVFD